MINDSPTSLSVKLRYLYGESNGNAIASKIQERLRVFRAPSVAHRSLDQSTVILITYADHIQGYHETPLESLHIFLKRHLADVISHVHILPFYPYSSDGGFSVIDYTAVNPDVGSWTDIAALQQDFDLMFDAVVNHISAKSPWFQEFLNDVAPYKDFFITLDSAADTSLVRRPRISPLLTPFQTASGTRHVWTTFSADQIDLNYANPDVLLAMIDVLLEYVARGAQFIRLDAITYLWKDLGTDCANLPETHVVVQIFREVLNHVAPEVQIITETNVPHHENIAYFGNGSNEAQGVYNFALPPLLVHTLQTGDKTAFETWLKTLSPPNNGTFFFNFSSSHDGIGLTPVKNLLSSKQINTMVEVVRQNGGRVNYKTSENGSEPYELNTTFYDAVRLPDDTEAVADKKFLLSQALQLAIKGVPGVYIGNLFGNKNWQAGVEQTGANRSINREKMVRGKNFTDIDLQDAMSRRGRIFMAYTTLLRRRAERSAFSPAAAMEVLDLHPQILAIRRVAVDASSAVLAVYNISESIIELNLEAFGLGIREFEPYDYQWFDSAMQ